MGFIFSVKLSQKFVFLSSSWRKRWKRRRKEKVCKELVAFSAQD
jgi:mRNA deadenylase 3'-5' endonuclease subunit Ccr4